MDIRPPADGVVVYCSKRGGPMFAHEKVTLSRVAETIAKLIGCKFSGEYDPARHVGHIYFVPDDTLVQDEALHLGIRSATALYGGVVPYPFVKTKAITHDLVSSTAIKPKGWSYLFAHIARGEVLPGYSVFSADDARIAGK